ncbi:hypothetical protein HAX54_027394, partial [Datura stramonium]|nr:hypothetical protein [Datura stramonium]
KEVYNESIVEDKEEIGMAPSANPEGEPSTQEEGTHGGMSNTSTEKGTSADAEPSDAVDAPEHTTKLDTLGDEPGSSRTTEQQEAQAGH